MGNGAAKRLRNHASRSVALITALLIMSGLVPGAAAAKPPEGRGPRTVSVVFSVDALRAGGYLSDESGPMAAPSTDQLEPQWGCISNCVWLENVRYAGKNEPFVTMVKGNGPGKLTLELSQMVTNGWTATLGLDAKVVSAGVEFNVSWSATQRYAYQAQVPKGACWTIRAYNIYYDYSYDVWHNPFLGGPYKSGSGRAWKFMGVKYVLTKTC
ncbi:hypothetical protein BH24CHL6_BH24CHL6_06950 [soil metagenome]